jgi:hypothetical protein
MKRLLFLLVFTALIGCTKTPEREQIGEVVGTSKTPDPSEKVTVVYTHPRYFYEIVEVDGHLYLANQKGGIVHLESCPCKTNLGKTY